MIRRTFKSESDYQATLNALHTAAEEYDKLSGTFRTNSAKANHGEEVASRMAGQFERQATDVRRIIEDLEEQDD